MHARNRSPGNGYRISPEGSGRGQVMYGSGYRNYNRGFGRGQPKPPFQPPLPPPPRRGDILVEAGRLATEYLVSKGVLPPSVLSGKWPNGSLKNQVGDFQLFRVQEGGDSLQDGGRTSSVLTRLRRTPDDDDYNPMVSKNNMKGRRRMGSFKSSGSEWNREIGRSSSWSDRAKERDEDGFSGYMEEQQVGKDSTSEEEQKLVANDLAPRSYLEGNSESVVEKNQLSDNVDSKASSSIFGKDVPPEADVESIDRGNCLMDESSNGESEKPSAIEDTSSTPNFAEEDNTENKSGGSDILTLCRFAKVPTRTRSSLTIRGSKIDPVLIAEDENMNESENSRESGVPFEDVSVDVSMSDAPSDQSQSVKRLETNISEESSVEDGAKLDLDYKVGQGVCTRSRSFPDRSFFSELNTSDGQQGINRSISMFMERGEKRALHHIDTGEEAKKHRDWTSSDAHADEYLHLSNLRGNQQSSQEGRSSGEECILDADEKKSIDASLFPKGGTQPCIEYAEEKQLFPASFKICDLNLMEAPDVNENHDANPILLFPLIEQNKKEAELVDIDLSMGSNCNLTDKHSRHGADGREVEVIDLESDSVQEDKAFSDSERKDETIFTDLGSFPDNARNVNEIPDTQDGYGLMISELLDGDISPVPQGINSSHNEIGLHDGEGMLGDDDSIYMSLGEIPICMPEI